MLDAYLRDPMEGGEPPPERIKRDLVPGLRAHPASYVFLAFRDGQPVAFSICFLGFSTFNARPLINIHDIFVDSLVRGTGIGAMLLERIEAKARELNCCRITLEVREDNSRRARTLSQSGLRSGCRWPQAHPDGVLAQIAARSNQADRRRTNFSTVSSNVSAATGLRKTRSASIGLAISPTAESTTTGTSFSFLSLSCA